jgi:hypothetical protein
MLEQALARRRGPRGPRGAVKQGGIEYGFQRLDAL